jgi:hypothetical protein
MRSVRTQGRQTSPPPPPPPTSESSGVIVPAVEHPIDGWRERNRNNSDAPPPPPPNQSFPFPLQRNRHDSDAPPPPPPSIPTASSFNLTRDLDASRPTSVTISSREAALSYVGFDSSDEDRDVHSDDSPPPPPPPTMIVRTLSGRGGLGPGFGGVPLGVRSESPIMPPPAYITEEEDSDEDDSDVEEAEAEAARARILAASAAYTPPTNSNGRVAALASAHIPRLQTSGRSKETATSIPTAGRSFEPHKASTSPHHPVAVPYQRQGSPSPPPPPPPLIPAAALPTAISGLVPAVNRRPLLGGRVEAVTVSLSTLSTQLALHMELQQFAQKRAAANALLGGVASASLIPKNIPVTPGHTAEKAALFNGYANSTVVPPPPSSSTAVPSAVSTTQREHPFTTALAPSQPVDTNEALLAVEKSESPVEKAAATLLTSSNIAATVKSIAAQPNVTSPTSSIRRAIRSLTVAHEPSVTSSPGPNFYSPSYGLNLTDDDVGIVGTLPKRKKEPSTARLQAMKARRKVESEVLDLFNDGPISGSEESRASFTTLFLPSPNATGSIPPSPRGGSMRRPNHLLGAPLSSIQEGNSDGKLSARNSLSGNEPLTPPPPPPPAERTDSGHTAWAEGIAPASVRTTVTGSIHSNWSSGEDDEDFIPPPPPPDEDEHGEDDIPPPPATKESPPLPPPSSEEEGKLPMSAQEEAKATKSASAAAPALETDDLTSIFQPDSTHPARFFPFRKVLRTPIHTTTCLTPPSIDATESQLNTQLRMLQLLSDSLRGSRADFKRLCVDNLRAENTALRRRVEELRSEQQGHAVVGLGRSPSAPGFVPGRSLTGLSGAALESAQMDSLRYSLRQLAPLARWNQEAHVTHDQLTLHLDELRRRCQLQLPASFSSALLAPTSAAAGIATHESEDELALKLATASHSPVGMARRGGILSPASPPTPARAPPSGPWSPTSSWDSVGGLVAPNSPILNNGANGAGSGPASPTTAASAQLHRFPITKINMIRKNTPRVLELDLTTKTLTICKQAKESKRTRTEGGGAGDDEHSNRDIVITAALLVGAEVHHKHELQLELSFHVPAGVAAAAQGPGMGMAAFTGNQDTYHPASASPLCPSNSNHNNCTRDKPAAAATLKHWKILFGTKLERDRFHRLLHLSLLENAGNSNGANNSDNRPGPLVSGGSNSGAGHHHNRTAGRAVASSDMHGTLSTLYCQNDSDTLHTYIPRSVQLTPTVLQQVRVLPLLPLASALHTIYCLQKKQSGWKYGLKLEDNILKGRKTHPLLVPFHALPPARRDYNIQVVTQTLSTVLALGFAVARPGMHSPTSTNPNGATNPSVSSVGGLSLLGVHSASITGTDTVDARTRIHLLQMQQQHQGIASTNQALLVATQQAQQAALNGSTPFTVPSSAGGIGMSPSPLAPGLLGMLDLLATGAHDLWSSDKLARGYKWGAITDWSEKKHPGLVPYAHLPPQYQEKERKQALKILCTLVEWGYAFVQSEGIAVAAANTQAISALSTPAARINPTIMRDTFIPPI